MKRLFPSLAATFCALVLRASTISVDPASHSVSFDVVSTDCGASAPLEFLIAGEGSDHDYEAMFLLADPAEELAAAFDKAGIPRGRPLDYRACRLWPVGDELTFEPDVWTMIKDVRDERKAPVVFTGGTRGADGVPEAAKNMPLAVFALYDCAQSLIQFDDALAQGATYGRFLVAERIPQGERRRITVRWNGRRLNEPVTLDLEPGALVKAITSLKEKSAAGELDVTVRFSGAMTVGEAAEAAAALQIIDSAAVKINGFAEGQFFYRAFLPLEKWRDRTERLSQPYEVRLAGNAPPRLTIVEEDWTSDTDSTDPRLIVHEDVPFTDVGAKGAFADTCLIFAPKTMPLKEVFAVRALLPRDVQNWYVYGEERE